MNAVATSRARRTVALSVAGAVLAVIALAAVAPTLLATHDPLLTDVRSTLQPPSAAHWFGTDQSGRDVYSRVVHGAGRSVGIGLLATVLALVIGVAAGSLSAVAPRLVDAAAMRVVDVLLAFPEFLVALLVVAVLGPGAVNVAIAVTIAAVPVYVRLARAQTRSRAVAEHVEAARLIGVPAAAVHVRHVLPGVLGAVSVLATIGIGTSILAAAGLSFLGLGPTEPTPEWGLMLSAGRNLLLQAPWVAVFPGLAITATVVSVSVVGRVLRSRAEERGA
ncbi:peptide/nickel transport system permease protein [Microbacterium sp. ru370.1]|uniref:ABC transporter permease n=1 Tax=unclassified Microbacterium TaxID=2609290 RepID=UPI0008839A15|nr:MULTISPECIES: ABC transporter permease [unclassified Microbacterium]SDO79044.1 peptide/nickel transport system permease protein [Microbacterium sp. ru370.1]SIT89352.1 peptide/nickel transport system permease protein [Microbacterium sp. RU1D]